MEVSPYYITFHYYLWKTFLFCELEEFAMNPKNNLGSLLRSSRLVLVSTFLSLLMLS